MLKNFVTFEGPEGCGKSTQVKLLSNYLTESGIPHITTREPGGTPLGEKLRSVMLDSEELESPVVEYLLLTAARKQHLETVILPALKQGEIVLCDRFTDSTLVYQCYLKGMDMWMFERLNDMLLGDVMPQLTFCLDIDTKIAISRVKSRADEGNFYDKKSEEFQIKLREAFLDVAAKNQDRMVVVNANGTSEEIGRAIKYLFDKKI